MRPNTRWISKATGGSRPVRVGNGAAEQTQLDIYGDLLETALSTREAGGRLDRETARRLAEIADLVCRIWRQADSGIWEVRSEAMHFTHSKMMCWVALDCALALAERRAHRLAPRDAWGARGGRDPRRSSRNAAGRRGCGAIPATRAGRKSTPACSSASCSVTRAGASRLAATVDAVRRELGTVRCSRYSGEDGLAAGRGRSSCCSFWLADALARIGRVDEATGLMEQLVALANDVGVYCEELDPRTGELLGNMPQGLVHLALINAAVSIAEASG